MIRTSSIGSVRRQRRHDERLERLLDVAQTIVRADGIEALTMPRLAAESDAAVGALYRYFASKGALLARLQVRAAADLGAFLEERLATVRGALPRVRTAFGTWAAWADRSPELFGLIDASLSDPRRLLSDEDARRVDEAVQPVLARCASLLEDAASEGALAPGDAELRAVALWAALRGVRHLAKRDRLQPERLHAARVAAVVLEGLLDGWRRDGDERGS